MSTELQAIASLGLLFLSLVGWIGARIINRLDRLTKFLDSDLRDIIHSLDKRIDVLEKWHERLEGIRVTTTKE